MCHCRILILVVLVVITGMDTRAQHSFNYLFRHIDQADGLLHNNILSIAQDGKGFIWIATPNGLQRYDGSRFIYYPEMLGNPAEGITAGADMYADKKNNVLWISNNSNLEKMELGNKHFTVYDPGQLQTNPSFALHVYHGINKEAFLVGQNAYYWYDSVARKYLLHRMNVLPANAHQASFIATDSSSGDTWVTTSPRLYVFNKKNKTVKSPQCNPGHHPLLQARALVKYLRFVMIDSRKNIWVTTWGDEFYKYDAETKKISQYSLSAIKARQNGNKAIAGTLLINCMLEDDNHSIWVGTETAGLLRYNPEKDNFDYCIALQKNSEGIRYDYKIFSLFQDKEQNIWVGTDKGINIFSPYRQYFKFIRHEENNPLSISKSEIVSFIQTTGGDIFIGTWGGGFAVYDSSYTFKRNVFYKTGAVEQNFVWSFLQMDNNILWIGCQHGYLLVYNMATGATQRLHPPEMEGATIRCMEKDDKGNIWFGLHNGKIIKWDKAQSKFIPYGTRLSDNENGAAAVLSIFIDRSQHGWVSTQAGFKQFDLEKMVYRETWLPDKNNINSISGKTCQGIEEYNDSVLLIGTTYGGLNFFNKRTKVFSHLDMTTGLPSNSVYAIKKSSSGDIWFTTDYGLYKFNPAAKKVIPYSMEPGAINSSFIANKFYPLQDGQWLTFTVAEAVHFFPYRSASGDSLPPKIEITGFRLFDKPVFIDSLLFEHKPVRLAYRENFFTVEFAALNFSGPQQTNYYYQLAGIDKDWVNGGTARFAKYTDLQPGEYTFNIKAENGNSGGETTSFKIIISPPFWETGWFLSIIIFCILLLIYGFVKWREKNIKAIAAEKLSVYSINELLSKAKLEALRSQMNPHFIFNCINSIDALIHSNDKYNATVYLNKFAKLLRNILDSSKQDTVRFPKDLEALKLYIELEKWRHENKFKPIFEIDNELLNSDYKVPPLIIQPYVENAILHGLKNKDGNDGILNIAIKRVNDKIQYIITDNGIGRDAAGKIIHNKETHYGMQMSYDRIKLFNKEAIASVLVNDLYENGNPGGTQVIVHLNII